MFVPSPGYVVKSVHGAHAVVAEGRAAGREGHVLFERGALRHQSWSFVRRSLDAVASSPVPSFFSAAGHASVTTGSQGFPSRIGRVAPGSTAAGAGLLLVALS